MNMEYHIVYLFLYPFLRFSLILIEHNNITSIRVVIICYSIQNPLKLFLCSRNL